MSYDKGNYDDVLRDKASSIDWGSLQDDDRDIYSNNINNAMNSIVTEWIPNKYVHIKPLEPL